MIGYNIIVNNMIKHSSNKIQYNKTIKYPIMLHD